MRVVLLLLLVRVWAGRVGARVCGGRGGRGGRGGGRGSSMSPEESRKEREARSLALERAYVHDVYDQISAHFSSGRHRVWPRVRQFLLDLEPGSFVADVGEWCAGGGAGLAWVL